MLDNLLFNSSDQDDLKGLYQLYKFGKIRSGLL